MDLLDHDELFTNSNSNPNSATTAVFGMLRRRRWLEDGGGNANSNANGNSNGNSNYTSSTTANTRISDPAITKGELGGAIVGGTISVLIALYFLLGLIRIRRFRKLKPSELDASRGGGGKSGSGGFSSSKRKQKQKRNTNMNTKSNPRKTTLPPQRRRRALSVDEIEGNESALTILEEQQQQQHHTMDHDDSDSVMATIDATPRIYKLSTKLNYYDPHQTQHQNHNSNNSNNSSDDYDTEADSCAYTLSSDEGDIHNSSYTQCDYSASASASATRTTPHTQAGSTVYTMDTRLTTGECSKHSSSAYTTDDDTNTTTTTTSCSSSSVCKTKFSVKSYSLTSAFMDVILPRSKHRNRNGNDNRNGNGNDGNGNDDGSESAYFRHDDDDDDDDDTASASASAWPHPETPPPKASNPAAVASDQNSSFEPHGKRTYFMSNDDSCIATGTGDDYKNDNDNDNDNDYYDYIENDGEDVFAGIGMIPDKEDHPFDCASSTINTCDEHERPFDCRRNRHHRNGEDSSVFQNL